MKKATKGTRVIKGTKQDTVREPCKPLFGG
jgi:hypothetical protein